MNILVLFGSPKKNGSTAKATGALMKGFKKDDDIEIVHLYDLMPVPCNACGYCKASDGCSKKDLEGFWQKYENAHAVVVATPVYNLSYPAPLKALFDRFQRFYEAHFKRDIENSFERPKKAVVLVTAGDDAYDGFEIIRKQTERSFSIMNTKVTGSLLIKNTDCVGVSQSDLQKAYELSKELY